MVSALTRLDQLKVTTNIIYRSNRSLDKRDAIFYLDDDNTSIHIEFPTYKEDYPPVKIFMNTILDIRHKDMKEDGTDSHILQVHFLDHKDDAKVQGVIIFEDRDFRDTWEMGIKRLMTGYQKPADLVPDDYYVPKQELAIFDIKILPTSNANELMKIELEIGLSAMNTQSDIGTSVGGTDRKKVSCIIPNCPTDIGKEDFIKTNLWETLSAFIDDNTIFKAETISLYRYIRAIVVRQFMEQEVKDIVSEINAQNLKTLIDNRGEKQGGVLDDNELCLVADNRLTVLQSELPTRLLSFGHGNGAVQIKQVLTRNINKMKLMNNMVVKMAAAEA